MELYQDLHVKVGLPRAPCSSGLVPLFFFHSFTLLRDKCRNDNVWYTAVTFRCCFRFA